MKNVKEKEAEMRKIQSARQRELKEEEAALRMVTNPELYLEQSTKLCMIHMLAHTLDSLVGDLEDTYLAIDNQKSVRNKLKTIRNIMDGLLDHILRQVGDRNLEEVSKMGYECKELVYYIVMYMSETKDLWRQEALQKKMNELVTEDVKRQKVADAEAHLRERYPEVWKKVDEIKKSPSE